MVLESIILNLQIPLSQVVSTVGWHFKMYAKMLVLCLLISLDFSLLAKIMNEKGNNCQT